MPKVHRPEPIRYKKVAALRLWERRGVLALTTAMMANHFRLGRRGRETASGWEKGLARCDDDRRLLWLRWLYECLHLTHDQIRQVWQALVDDWGWAPLHDDEIQSYLPSAQPPIAEAKTDGSQSSLRSSVPTDMHAPHHLRAPTRDFVGRAAELDQIIETFSQTSVHDIPATICAVRGLGGVGKTELAYAAANKLRETFPDAQVVLDLRGSTQTSLTPAQALHSIIHAFAPELKLTDDLTQLELLYRSQLYGKRVLILADDACDAAQLRPLIPPLGCGLLITSRQRFTLPGMHTIDLHGLADTEAVALLLAICPRIGVVAAEIARLCANLPLALRISAGILASDDTLSVQIHLAQLKDEQRLARLRDPDDSDLSVEASLRLSYDLLDPVAQDAICQLAVFSAGFDLEAAKAVIQIDEDVAAVLGRLRRHSLLEWDSVSARYGLHDLVRAFVTARLGNGDEVRHRYARHYAHIAARAGDMYNQSGQAQIAGLALFDRERIHIDTGWAWAGQHAGMAGADELLVDYATALILIGRLRYQMQHERIPQQEAALAAARRLGHTDAMVRLINNLGSCYCAIGQVRRAIEYHERVLRLSKELGNFRDEANALCNLGWDYYTIGDVRQVIAYYDQSMAILRQIDDLHGQSNALTKLGWAYNTLGEIPRAIDYYEQALRLSRELGDLREEGNALCSLASAYAALGQVQQSIRYSEQALTIAQQIKDQWTLGHTHTNLGWAYYISNDMNRALTHHERSVQIWRAVGYRQGEALGLRNLAGAYLASGQPRRAIVFCEQALTIAQELPDARLQGETRTTLGRIYLALEQPRQAIVFCEQALAIDRELGDLRIEGETLDLLGQAYVAANEPQQAIEAYRRALQIAYAIGNRSGAAEASWHLGQILAAQGDQAQALNLMQVRIDYEREIGHPSLEEHRAQLELLR